MVWVVEWLIWVVNWLVWVVEWLIWVVNWLVSVVEGLVWVVEGLVWVSEGLVWAVEGLVLVVDVEGLVVDVEGLVWVTYLDTCEIIHRGPPGPWVRMSVVVHTDCVCPHSTSTLGLLSTILIQCWLDCCSVESVLED